jgi:hypothetical protein
MNATDTVSVWRGHSTDDFGDEVDAPLLDETAHARRWPIEIVEKSRREQNPESGIWSSVVYLSGRLAASRRVEKGDRLRSDTTGRVYIVTAVKDDNRSIAGFRGVHCELRTTPGA